MKHLLALLTLLILLTSCQSPAPPEPTDPAAVDAAITDTWNRFAAFWAAGDAEGCASLYTEDAVNRPAPFMRQHGRDEIRSSFEEFFAGPRAEFMDRRTEEILVSGDLAVEFGFLSMRLISATDTTTSENNQYVSVFKRQPDGTWLFQSWMGDDD